MATSNMALTVGSYDLSLDRFGCTVLRFQVSSMADPQLNLFMLGGDNGATAQVRTFKPKYYTLTILCEGNTNHGEDADIDLRRKMDEIKAVLNPTLGRQYVQLHGLDDLGSGLTRGAYAIINGPLHESPKGPQATKFQINLVMLEGIDESSADVSQDVTIDADPKTFYVGDDTDTIDDATNATPIVITSNSAHGLSTGDRVTVASVGGNTAANSDWQIVVIDATTFRLYGSVGNGAYTSGGTWRKAVQGTMTARPTYTIVNTDASTITTLTLTNTTRSQELTWTGSLAQNDQLRIDTERQHIEKSTDGGSTWSNAMSGLTAGDPFPRLAAGQNNAFTIAGFVAGTINITYNARWL